MRNEFFKIGKVLVSLPDLNYTAFFKLVNSIFLNCTFFDDPC